MKLARFIGWYLLGTLPIIASPAQTEARFPPQVDSSDASQNTADPLPPGVVIRIGTPRLRHVAEIASLAMSPDGRIIASAARQFYPEPICTWDSKTGRKLQEFASGDYLVAIAPDNRTLATAGKAGNNAIRFWDLNAATMIRDVHVEGMDAARDQGISQIAFGPDPTIIVVETWLEHQRGMPVYPRTRTIRFIDARTGKQLRHFVTPQGKGTARPPFALQPNGRRLAVIDGRESTIHLVDADSAEVVSTLGQYATDCAFSADGKRLAMAEYRHVSLYDTSSQKELRRFQVLDGQYGNRPGQVALSPDATRLVASGDFHAPMNVWDSSTGQLISSVAWSGNERPGPVIFSPDGERIIVAVGPTIRVYDAQTGTELLFDRSWRRRLQAATFSPGGKTIAVCGYGDRGVRLHDVASGKVLHQVASDEKVRAVVFLRDGKTLATGGQTISLWNTENDERIRTVQRNLAPPRVTGPTITSIATSSDDRRLLTGSHLGTLQIFKLDDDKLLRSIPQPIDADGHHDRIRGVVCFPDGRQAATRTGDIHLWDLRSGELLTTWEAGGCDGEPGRPLALSPDGRLLAYERRVETDRGSKLESVLHDLKTLKPPRPLEIGENSSERFSEVSFAFSPDGRLLATGAADNSVRLWSVETCEELRRFDGHIDRVSYVDFSPDGKLLASASWDGTVLLWNVEELTKAKP